MFSSERFLRPSRKPTGAKPHGRNHRHRPCRRLPIERLEDRRMLDGLPLITELMRVCRQRRETGVTGKLKNDE